MADVQYAGYLVTFSLFIQQTKDTFSQEVRFHSSLLLQEHFNSVLVIDTLQTHTLTTSSQEGQIDHAISTFKLFRGRLSACLLEFQVNTFHHKCLHSTKIH